MNCINIQIQLYWGGDTSRPRNRAPQLVALAASDFFTGLYFWKSYINCRPILILLKNSMNIKKIIQKISITDEGNLATKCHQNFSNYNRNYLYNRVSDVSNIRNCNAILIQVLDCNWIIAQWSLWYGLMCSEIRLRLRNEHCYSMFAQCYPLAKYLYNIYMKEISLPEHVFSSLYIFFLTNQLLL